MAKNFDSGVSFNAARSFYIFPNTVASPKVGKSLFATFASPPNHGLHVPADLNRGLLRSRHLDGLQQRRVLLRFRHQRATNQDGPPAAATR